MRPTGFAILSSLMVLLGACGGGAGGAGGGAGAGAPGGAGTGGSVVVGTTIALADVATVGPAKICEYAVRCGYFPDQATCVAANPSDDGQLIADVQAGKAHYDGAVAASCYNGFAALTCHLNDPASYPTACDNVVKGTVAAGGVCSSDYQCVSQDCAIGTCDRTATCCVGSCRVVAVPVPLLGDCSTLDCASDAYCDNLQICQSKAAAGKPCSDAAGCLAGLTCAFDTATTGTCSAFALHGQLCDPTRIPCDLSTDSCDPVTMKCAPRVAVGLPCPTADSCVTYAYCSVPTGGGTCVALKGAGAPCGQDVDCLGALVCNNNVCGLGLPEKVCP